MADIMLKVLCEWCGYEASDNRKYTQKESPAVQDVKRHELVCSRNPANTQCCTCQLAGSDCRRAQAKGWSYCDASVRCTGWLPRP